MSPSYLVIQKDIFYDRAQFSQICFYLGVAELTIDTPPPAILKPAQRWTKRSDHQRPPRAQQGLETLVSLEAKTRSQCKAKLSVTDVCNSDGYLVIYNFGIMGGVLDKSIVRDTNKTSLFYIAVRGYYSIEPAKSMNRLAKLRARSLGLLGFLIGINDGQPGEISAAKKDELVRNACIHCDDMIYRSMIGQLETQPGYDIEKILKASISGKLSQVRDKIGDVC
ncbi:hypothetical protein BGX28_009168 [Mortierella sp. GBA30]|nr:hypothetical protein BGX28_009168 [Mortierella sp. GBA30]